MKANKIYVEKCFNLGGYENMKIGIELEVQEGEKAITVLNAARRFIADNDPAKSGNTDSDHERANYIVNNPDDFTGKEVKQAKQLIESLSGLSVDDLPF